ncbi:MAG TPA: hypothetical protein VKX39_18135 [Bryobacteraceae bacterium]|jgi:hypothetical protein|nr:hypothetical protein [Bryobacteraceae bacterium]
MRIRFEGLSLLAAACLLGTIPARAVPITYIVQTTASGTLNGVPFTSAGLTVALSGDTSGIVSLNPATQNFSLANPGAATLVISGLGAAAFTDTMAAVSTLNTPFDGLYAAGILDTTQDTMVALAEVQGYNLAASLSFSGMGGLGNGGGTQNTFPTTGGALIFARQQPPITVAASFSAILTTSLTNQGGPIVAPVVLTETTPLGQVNGTISGNNAQDYYSFYWNGGAFAASASITNALAGTSFQFSAGAAGSCNSIGSQTLNAGDGYSGTIGAGNLAPGQYCIGLTENGTTDPNYAITFNTPLTAPEPGTFLLFSAGVAVMVAVGGIRTRKSRN